MNKRKGEKVGWIGGWSGGFVWLLVLSVVWLLQGKVINGVIGLGAFGLAEIFIFVLSPWKHPHTRYWKLMLPFYLVLIASVGFYIFSEGGLARLGLSWWSIFLLLPLFIPFATMGSRCWSDGEKAPGAEPGH